MVIPGVCVIDENTAVAFKVEKETTSLTLRKIREDPLTCAKSPINLFKIKVFNPTDGPSITPTMLSHMWSIIVVFHHGDVRYMSEQLEQQLVDCINKLMACITDLYADLDIIYRNAMYFTNVPVSMIGKPSMIKSARNGE